MRVRWLGVFLVAVLVVCILWLKTKQRSNTMRDVNSSPAVVLVADFREANDSEDGCAAIIRAEREASRRGVKVLELPPNSNSDLLRRHHVLIAPTVLILDNTGHEVDRFEGEDAKTVKAVQERLSTLSGERR